MKANGSTSHASPVSKKNKDKDHDDHDDDKDDKRAMMFRVSTTHACINNTTRKLEL
jgi:hypothetical protein